MVASSRRTAGSDLREARTRLGVSRAELAGLADCSMAALGNIEQGAVPKRSRVLERAWQALDSVKRTYPPSRTDGSRMATGTDGRGHVAA